ncbi:MAG: TlpA family protein disulfide reductase [bacterium]|nr:TlpA family protein disulfide reductase [bacterium]
MDTIKKLSLVVLVALIFAVGCTHQGKNGGGVNPPDGFELLPGDDFNLSDYRGSVVVVDIWATWCAPCREEIPYLIEINNEYKDEGVVIIGINMDTDPGVAEFAEEVGMNYTNYIDEGYGLGTLYGVSAYPTKIFFDKNGNEAHRRVGLMSKEDIIAEVENLL